MQTKQSIIIISEAKSVCATIKSYAFIYLLLGLYYYYYYCSLSGVFFQFMRVTLFYLAFNTNFGAADRASQSATTVK